MKTEIETERSTGGFELKTDTMTERAIDRDTDRDID